MVGRVVPPFILSLLLTGCALIWQPEVGMPWAQEGGGIVDDVLVSLSVGYHSVKVGQPLLIRLTAHNEGKEMAVFQTTSKPVLDISIGATRPAEDKALPGLRWSDGKELPRNSRAWN